MFKKRSFKGQARQKDGDDVESESVDIDATTLQFVQMEQKLRQKRSGVGVVKEVGKTRCKEEEKSQLNKTIESAIDAQFLSKVDHGIGTDGEHIAHENLLEQFIRDKMGISDEL